MKLLSIAIPSYNAAAYLHYCVESLVIGVIDTNMMLIVTLSICAIFLIAYVLIFMITSRSYRKIVQM